MLLAALPNGKEEGDAEEEENAPPPIMLCLLRLGFAMVGSIKAESMRPLYGSSSASERARACC